MPRHVAILDDDAEFAAMLQHVLQASGYQVVSYPSVGKLLDTVLKKTPDLLVVDVNLPGIDGRELVRILRLNPQTARICVIVVSGERIETPEVVKGFRDGADEYLVKPFDLDHFIIRVAALLRRAEEIGGALRPPETLELGNLRMNLDERTVHLDGRRVRVTAREFELLHYFVTHPGRVVTRALLLEEIWKAPMETITRTVDSTVYHLRTKLKGFVGGRIETMVGIGYMFSADPDAAGPAVEDR